MSSSDVIAIFAIGVPVITIMVGAIISYLVRQNSVLRTKLELKTEQNAELKRQLDKMEITGTLVNRFFSQLPTFNSTESAKREIQP